MTDPQQPGRRLDDGPAGNQLAANARRRIQLVRYVVAHPAVREQADEMFVIVAVGGWAFHTNARASLIGLVVGLCLLRRGRYPRAVVRTVWRRAMGARRFVRALHRRRGKLHAEGRSHGWALVIAIAEQFRFTPLARAKIRMNAWGANLKWAPLPTTTAYTKTLLSEVYTLKVNPGGNVSSEVIIKASAALADNVGKPCFGVDVYRHDDGGGYVNVEIQRVDINRRLLGRHPIVDADYGLDVLTGLLFGDDDRGRQIVLDVFESSAFYAGLPRTGKSTALNLWIAFGALCDNVAVVVIDAKYGLEGDAWKRCCLMYADNADDADVVISALAGLPHSRGQWCKANGQRKIVPSSTMPVVLVVVDEMAELHPETLAKLRALMGLGSAMGIVFVGATQTPSVDLIPARVRDKFRYSISYRVRDVTVSNVALGAGAAGRGYDASKLPPKAVCFVLGQEEQAPRRVRTYRLDDAEVATIAAKCEAPKALLYATVREQPWASPILPFLDTEPQPGGSADATTGAESNEGRADAGESADPGGAGPSPRSDRTGPSGASERGGWPVPPSVDGKPKWLAVWRALLGHPSGASLGQLAEFVRGAAAGDKRLIAGRSTMHAALKSFESEGFVTRAGLLYVAVRRPVLVDLEDVEPLVRDAMSSAGGAATLDDLVRATRFARQVVLSVLCAWGAAGQVEHDGQRWAFTDVRAR